MSDSRRNPEAEKLLGALERTRALLSQPDLPRFCVFCGIMTGPYELSTTTQGDTYEYGPEAPRSSVASSPWRD